MIESKQKCEHVDAAGQCPNTALWLVADAVDPSPDASIATLCDEHVANGLTVRRDSAHAAWWTVHPLVEAA